MKTWVVRLVTLTLFNVAVLAAIVLLVRSVHGRPLGILWAALLLTAATIWIKPALSSIATKQAARGASARSASAQKLIGYLAVFAVAFVIWILTVWLTDVRVYGWFWGYVIPPLALLVAWFVYDIIDDQLEAKAGEVYDAAQRKLGRTK